MAILKIYIYIIIYEKSSMETYFYTETNYRPLDKDGSNGQDIFIFF